jgi:hypothetical protein
MNNDNPTAELRSMIARERLKAARTQGASIGTPFCAASRAAWGPRSLAERSRMADHSLRKSVSGESRFISEGRATPWQSVNSQLTRSID